MSISSMTPRARSSGQRIRRPHLGHCFGWETTVCQTCWQFVFACRRVFVSGIAIGPDYAVPPLYRILEPTALR